MHENQCSEPVCWLKQFCKTTAALAAPKFCIGQSVKVEWFSEECDRTMVDQGVIVGFVFRFPEALVDGWWYAVQFTEMDSCNWMPRGHVDWAHESNLRVGARM